MNTWKLINNTTHQIFEFPSQKKLRGFAMVRGWEIKKSRLDQYTFYTDSMDYISAR